MKSRFAVVCLVLAVAACQRSPGRPRKDSKVARPDQITDFKILYGQNCAGCHGTNGKRGGAVQLSDPVFLAIADDAVIRRTAANGVPGTSMPAFAQSAGGMLTDQQLDAIVGGIRGWARPGELQGVVPPPYAAQEGGNAEHGATAYATYCASCHGADGKGTKRASSIVNASYLALVSDQNLRTNVIVGRPDLGAPDWRGDLPGHPLSSQEISDVVAWLAAQRSPVPGQVYPGSSKGSATRVIP